MSQSTHHGIYLSGLFEIEKKVTPEHGWRSEWRTYTASIGCGGADCSQRLLYDIQARAFSPAQFRLWADHVYFLRGSFFPSNTSETESDQLIFEGSDISLIAPFGDFVGDVVDTVGVTGVGIAVEVKTIVEECCQGMKKGGATEDLLTTVVTIQHSDYNPVAKGPKTSKVEYLIRPTPNLTGIAGLIKKGRECQIHGYIKDFNEDTCCYVVVANKVYLTDSFPDEDKPKSKASVGDSASKKPMKYKAKSAGSAFESPLTVSDSASSAALPSASITPPDFSSSSSALASTSKVPMNTDFETLDSLPTPAPKGKGRRQPKRKATNDIAREEAIDG